MPINWRFKMRKLFVALLALALSPSAFAQDPKSDAGREGLKGKVRSVTTRESTTCRNDQKEGEFSTSSIDGNTIIASTLSPCGNGLSEKEPYSTKVDKYDRQGNSTKTTYFTYKDLASKSLFRVIDGDKTRKDEAFDLEGNPAPPGYVSPRPRDPRYDYRYKYRYDGNKVEILSYDSYGYLFDRSVVTHNEKGNRIRYESYTNKGELFVFWTFAYDAQGNETEMTTYIGNGTLVAVFKYSDYAVDSRGNWVKRKVLERFEGKPSWTNNRSFSRTITYYDDPASKQ